MTCDEFETHLNEILDERRRPESDERLQLHGDICPGCRQLAAAYGVLFDGLFALPMPQAAADLGARVLDELQVRRQTSSRVTWVTAVFSTAAVVMVAVFLTWGSREPQVAQAPVVPPASTQATQKVPRPEDLRLDLQKWQNVSVVGPALVSMSDDDPNTDPYAEMAKGTGRGLASVMLQIPRLAGPEGVRPPGANGSGVLPARMSEELRPVTESMTETFNLLLDTLPLTFWSQTPAGDS